MAFQGKKTILPATPESHTKIRTRTPPPQKKDKVGQKNFPGKKRHKHNQDRSKTLAKPVSPNHEITGNPRKKDNFFCRPLLSRTIRGNFQNKPPQNKTHSIPLTSHKTTRTDGGGRGRISGFLPRNTILPFARVMRSNSDAGPAWPEEGVLFPQPLRGRKRKTEKRRRRTFQTKSEKEGHKQ